MLWAVAPLHKMPVALALDSSSSMQVRQGFEALVASGREHYVQYRLQRNDIVLWPCLLCFLWLVFLSNHIGPRSLTHRSKLRKIPLHQHLQAKIKIERYFGDSTIACTLCCVIGQFGVGFRMIVIHIRPCHGACAIARRHVSWGCHTCETFIGS